MNAPQRADLLRLLDWHNRLGVLVVALAFGIIIALCGHAL